VTAKQWQSFPRQARPVARASGRARSDGGTDGKSWRLGNERLDRDDLYEEIIARNTETRFALDTSILVYAISADAETRHEPP
jgi:hypothetical protein